MRRSSRGRLLIATIIAGATACATGGEEKTSEASAPQLVEVEAAEYSFVMPDTLAPGLTTFRLHNNGKALHHMTIARLEDGHTMADMGPALADDGPPPDWMVFFGGPNPVGPGQSLDATVQLEPGNYAVFCVVPGPDGKPHAASGMVDGFVVAGDSHEVEYQAPTMTVSLVDYGFTWSSPLTLGHHRIRVSNDAQQPHELVILRLTNGVDLAGFFAWMEGGMNGPPPVEAVGGTATMSPGIVNDIELDLTPGRYALICFVPDAGDGAPHFVHGMAQEIEIS